MKEEIVSFEVAKLAKEKGFNSQVQKCYAGDDKQLYSVYLDNHNGCNYKYSAPTQSLLQKWLREVHKIEVLPYCNASGWCYEINKAHYIGSLQGGTHILWSNDDGPNKSGCWDYYEQALEEGLKEALRLI